MKLLVTAFGPFGGRTCNASSLALAELKRRLTWLNTRMLPVDSVVAPLRLNQALRQVKPDALVLLGEAGGSKTIRLETTAWNVLDFRIPDIAGRQPQGQPISAGAPDILCSSLPFDRIHERLSQAGHLVTYSDDPGRYLCNQILYHTLRCISRSQAPVPAGFIHLPYESDYPTRRAADALELVIDEIRKAEIGGRKSEKPAKPTKSISDLRSPISDLRPLPSQQSGDRGAKGGFQNGGLGVG